MCHLQELHNQFRDKGLVILGFNSADDKQIALEFMAENGATFPTILDSSDEAMKVGFQDYRGSGVPLNYVIDREGKVVDAWYGYEKGHPRAMAALEKTGGRLKEAIRQAKQAKSARPAKDAGKPPSSLLDGLRSALGEEDGD
jgi:peroxiredoxin